MFSKDFINNFSALGDKLLDWAIGNSSEPELEDAIYNTYKDNNYFTPYMQRNSIVTIAKCFLREDVLYNWGTKYDIYGACGYNIGVNCAGNIPLVGFHDLLCVIATGSKAIVKLSSKDRHLLPAIFNILLKDYPLWRECISFVDSLYLNDSIRLDAILSMGSDNSVSALKASFTRIPSVLRGHRFSFAVIRGDENRAELKELANDMLLYFGKGCRSVSYLLVPKGYNFDKLKEEAIHFSTLLNEKCYINSLKRERAVLIMRGERYIDGEFFLLKYSKTVDLPVGVIGVMEYVSDKDIEIFEDENKYYIQKKYCNFGTAQAPLPDDYPNREDVIQFILKLKN